MNAQDARMHVPSWRGHDRKASRSVASSTRIRKCRISECLGLTKRAVSEVPPAPNVSCAGKPVDQDLMQQSIDKDCQMSLELKMKFRVGSRAKDQGSSAQDDAADPLPPSAK
ncbi:unnamed protein product [Symbiodinium sp. CCMP2592]|nr:unnamed protein product [Symbiodinium sp. CCMP2592]CAE7488227.1 unnamed protein product [Symbiodinium sp. CCMP2592]